jgi:hypothetical protein
MNNENEDDEGNNDDLKGVLKFYYLFKIILIIYKKF